MNVANPAPLGSPGHRVRPGKDDVAAMLSLFALQAFGASLARRGSVGWGQYCAIVAFPFALGFALWAGAAFAKLQHCRRAALLALLTVLVSFQIFGLIALFAENGSGTRNQAAFQLLGLEACRQALSRRADFRLAFWKMLGLALLVCVLCVGFTFPGIPAGATFWSWKAWRWFWVVLYGVPLAFALLPDVCYRSFALRLAAKGYPDAGGEDFYGLLVRFGDDAVRRAPRWGEEMEILPGFEGRSRGETLREVFSRLDNP